MAVTLNANTSTGFIATSDTSGVLQLQTGGTTALAVSAAQVVTLTNPLPVASGGSGGTTSTGTGANVLGTTPSFTSTIGVGGATASASGAGITFPSTDLHYSTNANTLDDYEEGTWTPTVAGGYTGITYNTQNGYYTKIGRLVNIVCYVQFSGTSNSSIITVGGLPFQLNGGGNAGTVGYWDVTTDGNISAWIGSAQTVIFYKIGTTAAATSTGSVTNKFIIFSITGFV